MKNVKFVRTLWGINFNFSDFKSVRNQLNFIKEKGFSGIEIATGFFDQKYRIDFQRLCKDLDLEIITQIHTLGYPIKKSSPNNHMDDFKFKVEEAVLWEPKLINVHDGRDDWSLEQSIFYFTNISDYESKLNNNIQIAHETHRQRILNNHIVTREIIKYCPKIWFTADFSHWIINAERFISEETDENWEELVSMMSKRTKMIHARIGTTQQIQCIDPNSFDNKEFKEYFYSIWKKIQMESDIETLYVDIEYGPQPYAIINPSGLLVKDVNEVILNELVNLKQLFNI